MSRRNFQVLTAAALLIGACRPLEAQQRTMSRSWIVVDAIGYGALGLVGAGMLGLATEGGGCGFAPCETTAIAALAGAGVGTMGGAAIAASARKKIERGETLTQGHRAAVTLGAILGGATIGAIASSLMINDAGPGTPIGSDEFAFLTLTAGGLVGSAIYVGRHRHELEPPKLNVRPVVGRKLAGMSARLTF